MAKKLYLDFGNYDVKWFDGGVNRDYFRHAIVSIGENDWQRQLSRNGGTPPRGYIKVDGMPYVVGDAARRHMTREKPSGAARYERDYYGIGLAMAMAQAFQKSQRRVKLYATHAPQDIDFVPDIEDAAIGAWHVISEYGEHEFYVTSVDTLDEPLGGFGYYVLTKDGREKRNNPIAQDTVLVLDIGGHTVDVVAIDEGGMLDVGSMKSTRTGVGDMMREFEDNLRGNNRDRFKRAGDLDIRRLEKALMQGVYAAGNNPISCHHEAREAINGLTSDVVKIIESAGGVVNYDICLLTGGGAALLADALRTAVPDIDFLEVEPNRDDMRYANIFGTARTFNLIDRMYDAR
jgi:hypothetical protein